MRIKSMTAWILTAVLGISSLSPVCGAEVFVSSEAGLEEPLFDSSQYVDEPYADSPELVEELLTDSSESVDEPYTDSTEAAAEQFTDGPEIVEELLTDSVGDLEEAVSDSSFAAEDSLSDSIFFFFDDEEASVTGQVGASGTVTVSYRDWEKAGSRQYRLKKPAAQSAPKSTPAEVTAVGAQEAAEAAALEPEQTEWPEEESGSDEAGLFTSGQEAGEFTAAPKEIAVSEENAFLSGSVLSEDALSGPEVLEAGDGFDAVVTEEIPAESGMDVSLPVEIPAEVTVDAVFSEEIQADKSEGISQDPEELLSEDTVFQENEEEVSVIPEEEQAALESFDSIDMTEESEPAEFAEDSEDTASWAEPAFDSVPAAEETEEMTAPADPAVQEESDLTQPAQETAPEELPFSDQEAAMDGSVTELPEETALVEEAPEEDPQSSVSEVGAQNTGSTYFTSQDGVVSISTTTENGSTHLGWYLFDKNGVMLYGAQKAGEDSYYFRTYAEAELDSGVSASEKTPWNSTYGQALRNCWRWDKSAGAFSRYDYAGKFNTVAQLNAQAKTNGKFTGYFQIAKGVYYCLNSAGVPRTGTIKLTGSSGKTFTYYFSPQKDSNGIPGAMFHDGWLQDTYKGKERWRFFSRVSSTIGQLRVHNHIVTKLDTAVKGNDYYLLSPSGLLCINLARKAENGKYYQGDAKGRIIKNQFGTSGGKTFYYLKNGARAEWKKMWHTCPGDKNNYYYFGSLGQVVPRRGWQKVTNANGSFKGWYYFDEKGKQVRGKWVNDHTRYVNSNGKVASGFQMVNRVRYYFKPSTSAKLYGKISPNAMISYKNRNYFTDSKGALIEKGWVTYKGKLYYLQNFRQATKVFAYTNSGNYVYIDKAGDLHGEGWYVENDASRKVRYISASAGGFVKNTSRWIDGLLFYFDESGYRRNDVSDRVDGPYYVIVDRVNGVMTVYNEDGNIPVKAIRVSVGAEGMETPTGTYTLSAYMRWTPLNGPSYGQYGSHVVDGIFVHSIPCNTPSIYDVPADMYYMLGYPASHGCIRCCVRDAKWIYYNCDGAAITITDYEEESYESMKGPLGRPILIPMTGTFDPTDPEVVGE